MESIDRDQARERVERAAREALAVVVGMAVLGVNRVQVERRRLSSSLGCEDRCRRTVD